MSAYKCDRCGAFATRNIFVRKQSRFVYRFGKKRHLCADCAKSFRRWFSDPKTKEGNNDIC